MVAADDGPERRGRSLPLHTRRQPAGAGQRRVQAQSRDPVRPLVEHNLHINGKPFYFRGFGRHEDWSIHGKGIDNANIVKDHNLVKWTGANSYRTSHYPYVEENMYLTDQLGIVVVDEVPAVALDGFGAELLENHKQAMREPVQREKNRPSVVMWSVGNEPQSQKKEADPYFG